MHMKYWVNMTYTFEMAAILPKILNVALLSVWLNLEALYVAQLCIYTGATYRAKNYASANNILKIMNF